MRAHIYCLQRYSCFVCLAKNSASVLVHFKKVPYSVRTLAFGLPFREVIIGVIKRELPCTVWYHLSFFDQNEIPSAKIVQSGNNQICIGFFLTEWQVLYHVLVGTHAGTTYSGPSLSGLYFANQASGIDIVSLSIGSVWCSFAYFVRYSQETFQFCWINTLPSPKTG